MKNSIEDNIKEWLINKGFPFEIECSQMLKKYGFNVQPALHYLDEEIKTYREIDICAWKSYSNYGGSVNLTLMIECKTSELPWIVFMGAERSKNEFLSNLLISSNGNRLISKLKLVPNNTFTFSILKNETFGYNFIQMKKNNGDREKDHAYEAIIQSMKASLTLQKETNKSKHYNCNLYIPVVIVDKNLFKVSESNDSKKISIEETKFCKHGRLFAFSDKPFLVHHIVSGKNLEEYCKQISDDFAYFFDTFKEEMDIILNQDY